MTKDEALDLALEALEELQPDDAYPYSLQSKAITAIKQARALDKKAENARELGLDYEPVPENFIDALRFDVAMRDAAPVQEPEIVQRVRRYAGQTMRTARNPNITARECIELANWLAANTTPPAAQPAPVQELQRYSPNGEGGMEVDSLGAYVKHRDVTTPPAAQPEPVQDVSLIDEVKTAAQRQWVGLTGEDMPDIRAGDHAFLSGARWAEAKLKEKNNA